MTAGVICESHRVKVSLGAVESNETALALCGVRLLREGCDMSMGKCLRTKASLCVLRSCHGITAAILAGQELSRRS